MVFHTFKSPRRVLKPEIRYLPEFINVGFELRLRRLVIQAALGIISE